MKKSLFGLPLMLSSVSVVLLAIGCAPSATQIGKALEADPDPLLKVIEKHPDKFMAALQNAARNAEQKAQESAASEEKNRVAAEEKNPLQPDLVEDRAWRGPKDAPVWIVAYSDFQCPYCSRGFTTI